MNPSRSVYDRPRLGASTATLLAVLGLAEAALALALRDAGGASVLVMPIGWLWLGLVWGTLAAGTAICAGHSAARLGLLMAVVLVHVVEMRTVRAEPLARYVVLMGGYALLHTAALRAVGLPLWELAPEARGGSAPRRQFSILGLLGITTAVAALCAALFRYSIEHFDSVGTPLAVAILGLVALLAADVALAPRRRLGSLLLLVAALTIAPTALGMLHAWAVGGTQAGLAFETGGTYAVVISVFAAIMVSVHWAGRIDGLRRPGIAPQAPPDAAHGGEEEPKDRLFRQGVEDETPSA